MPLIKAQSGIITQVNIFEAFEGKEQALLALLREAALFSRETPGWLSASLHRSLDGRRIVNYAQSDSIEAAQDVIERLREAGFLERNSKLGTASPGLYEVVWTLEKGGGGEADRPAFSRA